MGEIDNTNDSPYFDGWEGYVDSQLQDNAPTREEYFGIGNDEPQDEPGAVQQIIGGGINIANKFLEENVKDPIENKLLAGTIFAKEEGSSGGGEGTGKPARVGFHNFKKDPICVQNCIVQCPFGITFCKMQPTPVVRPAHVDGKGFQGQMLTIFDHMAFTNVFPYNLFTLCQNPFNPYVIWATALATAAKGGVFTFTPWLCVGSIPLFSYVQPFWTPTQGIVKTNGMLALTQSSKIQCWWPADLTIVHPGQGLDASWGKAMFLGPGGLAGIQNIVNMAGSIFSIAGSYSKIGAFDKASSICDLLDGSINLLSGDIIGALFSGASGTLGFGGDNLAVNRGIKKIADMTSDLLNKGIKKLEIADVRRSARALGDDMPPATRNQFNDALERAENMNARHPQHNADGTLATPNTPHGDTISVNSSHPHGGDAPSSQGSSGSSSHGGRGSNGSDNWNAKYRNEADVPTVEKRKEARDAYREFIKTDEGKKWLAARDKVNKNPPVSQKEIDNLEALERNKTAAHQNLDNHPEPSRTEMDKKKAKSDASKDELKNYPEPTADELRGLEAKKKAMEDAQAKVDNNRVTPEERQHLKELEDRYKATSKQFSDDVSLANNEADIKAWKEYEAEKARIAEKDRLFDEGQQELTSATNAYTSEKNRIDAKQSAHNKAAEKAKTDEEAYLAEKRQYEQDLADHKKAKEDAKKADDAYQKEKERQETKQSKHDEAVAEADSVKPDNEDFLLLGQEQDNQSGIIEGMIGQGINVGKTEGHDGINDWAKEVAPKEKEKKEDPEPIDTSWEGYDFTLDYEQ